MRMSSEIRQVVLISEKITVNYVFDLVSKKSETEIKEIYLIDEFDDGFCYSDIPITKLSDYNISDIDNIIVAVQDVKTVNDVLSKIIPNGTCYQEKEIFLLRPSCVCAKSNFYSSDGGFERDKVINLPFSAEAFDIVSQKVHKVISPGEITTKVYATYDNIKAYKIEDVYVKYIRLNIGLIGCIYTSEGLVLDSCLNGRAYLLRNLEDVDISKNNDVTELDDVCVLTRIWVSNYFHCMLEMIDKILIAEELGFKGKYLLYSNSDIRKMISFLGIEDERIVWVDLNKEYHITSAFEIDGISMYEEKTISRVCAFCNDVVKKLNAAESQTDYPKMIYVPRTGSRKLLGAEEIIKKFNFFTFIPEEHTLEEEILYFHNADIVLCPHGAAICNALFMREGAVLIETCPCNWTVSSMMCFIIVKAKKLIYRQIVEPANANPKESKGQFRDYRVNNAMLEYALNELEAIRNKENDILNIKNSLSFRIGRIVTFIPRKIRDLFKKKK